MAITMLYSAGKSLEEHLKKNNETLVLECQQYKGGKYKLLLKEALLRKNINLIANEVMKYHPNGNFEDFMQEGAIGFLDAIDKYDSKKGNKFSTFAVYLIKQNVHRSLQDKYKSLIRTPNDIHDKISKLRRKYILDEKITSKQIENHLKTTLGHALRVLDAIRIDHIYSLDMVINADEDVFLSETLGKYDKEAPDFIKNVIIQKCISKLEKRDKLVIERRHYQNQTLRQIGEELGLSRERVRQIEQKALRKLKRDEHIIKLGKEMGYYQNEIR
jgi:RNA polymerase sigma factor (sigma-70 family)